jgi:hypothetical protein
MNIIGDPRAPFLVTQEQRTITASTTDQMMNILVHGRLAAMEQRTPDEFVKMELLKSALDPEGNHVLVAVIHGPDGINAALTLWFMKFADMEEPHKLYVLVNGSDDETAKSIVNGNTFQFQVGDDGNPIMA